MMKLIFNLHIFSALIILALGVNSFSTAFAQSKIDKPQPTEVERKEAEEIAIKFALRFSQTKDLNFLFKDFFSDDFVEQYKTLTLKDVDENDKDVWVYPAPRVSARTLKSLSNEDWKRLFISVNNYFLSITLFFAKEKSGGKTLNDDAFDKIFPAKLKNLFAKNPNLAGLIDDQQKSKPIDSRSELKTALDTINAGTKIFNKEHRESLTRAEAKQVFDFFENRNESKMRLEISNGNDYFGLSKGTRIIFVVTPLAYTLVLTKKQGKLKVILAEVFDD